MYISASESVFMIICGGIMGFMLLMLFIANYTLLKENRYLKSRLRAWRKACERRHAEVPF
jgi:hypothetical protein